MNEVGIKKVLNRFSIPYYNHRVENRYFMIPCPFAEVFHKSGIDNNPSFGIAIREDDESFFNCFSCKQKGKLFMLPDMLARSIHKNFGGDPEGVFFVQDIEFDQLKQIDFKTRLIIDLSPNDQPIPLNKAIYSNFYQSAWDNEVSRQFLIKRGVTEEGCKKIGIQYDPETDRVIFSVYGIDKQLYGFTGRAIDESKVDTIVDGKIYPKVKDFYGLKKRHFLLGEHAIDKNKPTLIVEGLFAYACLISKNFADICNVVAVLGSAMTPEKVRKLIKFDTSIYLMFDNDKAGDIGLFGEGSYPGAIKMLANYCTIFVPAWPEGLDDIDNLTIDMMIQIIQNTPPYN